MWAIACLRLCAARIPIFAPYASTLFAGHAKKYLAMLAAPRIIRAMTLDAYLKANKLTNVAFAARVGVDQSTIARLRAGQVPGRELMRMIFDETGGDVRADDFYGIEAQ
jgi:hypothetical protein